MADSSAADTSVAATSSLPAAADRRSSVTVPDATRAAATPSWVSGFPGGSHQAHTNPNGSAVGRIGASREGSNGG